MNRADFRRGVFIPRGIRFVLGAWYAPPAVAAAAALLVETSPPALAVAGFVGFVALVCALLLLDPGRR